MKVLVTGGSGFVGSHVAYVLEEQGHDVTVFDLVAPRRDCRFKRGDLTRREDVIAATAGMDAVCHLGAVGDVYGVEVCPIVELARRGGLITRRLIGEHWASPATLGPRVQALVRGSTR